MNYPESTALMDKIQRATKILINCHHNPDADSVGAAIAMTRLLKFWKREVRIISPSALPINLNFVLKNEMVETVDFSTFPFGEYDLFIVLDSGSWHRVSGAKNMEKPGIPIVVIDHHVTNQKFGEINLVVTDAPATCEVLYFLFGDWKVVIDNDPERPDLAKPLLTGIIGDTGAFRFPEADSQTLVV